MVFLAGPLAVEAPDQQSSRILRAALIRLLGMPGFGHAPPFASESLNVLSRTGYVLSRSGYRRIRT
jgi:hypothetical protein